ncbi:uncharacterized protein LOC116220519 [Clupea harengus]|uniref:Uncharacterized protein LOC116220519 n=1 Tax=Clupea harengus TaxID=7950 RepID=A0A6P8FDN4_CLUHA|nr:uncharacterized protein LOC116220519 [Clupea harengus]XP_031423636.1 uncharacterized protein LOC116220519 [Clupea harengus]
MPLDLCFPTPLGCRRQPTDPYNDAHDPDQFLTSVPLVSCVCLLSWRPLEDWDGDVHHIAELDRDPCPVPIPLHVSDLPDERSHVHLLSWRPLEDVAAPGPDVPHVAEVVSAPGPDVLHVAEVVPAVAPDMPPVAETEMEPLPPPSYSSLDLPPPYPMDLQPAVEGFDQQGAPPSYSEVFFSHHQLYPQYSSVADHPTPQVELPYPQTHPLQVTIF